MQGPLYFHVSKENARRPTLGLFNQGWVNMAYSHRFHCKHGKHIAISKEGQTARRQRSKGHAGASEIVFSHQPLRNGEIFEFKIDEEVSMMNDFIQIRGSGYRFYTKNIIVYKTTKINDVLKAYA